MQCGKKLGILFHKSIRLQFELTAPGFSKKFFLGDPGLEKIDLLLENFSFRKDFGKAFILDPQCFGQLCDRFAGGFQLSPIALVQSDLMLQCLIQSCTGIGFLLPESLHIFQGRFRLLFQTGSKKTVALPQ